MALALELHPNAQQGIVVFLGLLTLALTISSAILIGTKMHMRHELNKIAIENPTDADDTISSALLMGTKMHISLEAHNNHCVAAINEIDENVKHLSKKCEQLAESIELSAADVASIEVGSNARNMNYGVCSNCHTAFHFTDKEINPHNLYHHGIRCPLCNYENDDVMAKVRYNKRFSPKKEA
jgi:hypothetical protein